MHKFLGIALLLVGLTATACAPTADRASSVRANAETASNADFGDRVRARQRWVHASYAREIARAEIEGFDGRQVTAADVARLAVSRVNARQPNLPRAQHREALATADAEIRRELEARRRSTDQEARLRREVDLARLATTGLAGMPREIALAASQNLADSRSPFDARPSQRPDPATLRQEEVRLRNAIASRMAGERQQADVNAAAAARRQQEDLQRAIEMARADAERERRDRQSNRLIELGLGMAAGGNRRPAPQSNDGIRTYNVNGRSFTCTTSGPFTNCY